MIYFEEKPEAQNINCCWLQWECYSLNRNMNNLGIITQKILLERKGMK